MELVSHHHLFFIIVILLWAASFISIDAKLHSHTFIVDQTLVKRLCHTRNILTVNGLFPGPTLEINNGDTLAVAVINNAPYNISIHWHGVRQMRTGWADGAEFVTQCPIKPGQNYTYKFTVDGKEGTLWWHAHSSWLRATVYGALVIHPRESLQYLHASPDSQIPILLGEWWNANPMEVARNATGTGGPPIASDAYTINGQPGDMFPCSRQDTFRVSIGVGERKLLRVINAAVNQPLFFTIADHDLTVVGADGSYTKNFTTNILMLGPGQTTDVLLTGSRPPGQYYMAARPYHTAKHVPFDNSTAIAILQYASRSKRDVSRRPMMPSLPTFDDGTAIVTNFTNGFRSTDKVSIPSDIDENLFFAIGLGLKSCPPTFNSNQCQGPGGSRISASMNNVSFVLPSSLSLLQAHQYRVPGVFTTDFPGNPPEKYDYTGNVSRTLWQPASGTEIYKLEYGSRVQIVLQGTNIAAAENHPVHLHGYDFFVVAQGFGNFNPEADAYKFNLIDPPLRNTVSVPVNGWTVIRFLADNPGVWLMHCHLDIHVTWGLAMAFLVENGAGESQSLSPPPEDLPPC